MTAVDPREDAGHADPLASHIGWVYHFCRRMTVDETAAEAATCATFARASAVASRPSETRELSLWLLRRACEALAPRLVSQPEVSFEQLDDTLRSETTRTGEAVSIARQERSTLLWELKQSCLTAVINCLPPGERVAFVMSDVFGLSDDEGARAIGIKASAFKVRLSRARLKLGDYLAPRCEHVNQGNPCHCTSRVGIALEKGFIQPRTRPSLVPQRPFVPEPAAGNPLVVFRTLPELVHPADLEQQILHGLATGQWPDAVVR